MVRFITKEERCWEEGEYVAGVVVEYLGNYFWLGEDGTCTEADEENY